MPYVCALTINDRLALNTPLIFEGRADVQALAGVLRRVYHFSVTMTTVEHTTIAQPFNLRAFSWWLNPRRQHLYEDLEQHYRRNLMVMTRVLADQYLAPFTPSPLRREPIWVPELAPPIINYYWQDQQLDRVDFHDYLALGDPPPREFTDTWWFHSQLDREDFEEYLAQDGQEQMWRDNPLTCDSSPDEDSVDSFLRYVAADKYGEWSATSDEAVYTSDLFKIYAEAHDFDEWD
ncbi:hypothetical protein Dcae01_01041 [Deinococcus caeni]|uniref:Uncharacterized protein n=1 Tax=Deinococcus caeni TaxID=569127 RepID=A0ABP9UBG5_9DEIO